MYGADIDKVAPNGLSIRVMAKMQKNIDAMIFLDKHSKVSFAKEAIEEG